MKPIKTVYKTMFNHFVKKDGYSSSSHVIAGAATFLNSLFFLLNCYFIVKVLFNNPISFSVQKGTGMFIAVILTFVNHYLLFNVFRFSKNGDGPNQLFNLTRKEYNAGWWFFGINIFLMFAMLLLSKLLYEKFQIGPGY